MLVCGASGDGWCQTVDIQIVLKMKTLLGVLWCCWLLTLTGNTDLVF